jgi:hypothetical protein
MNNKEMCETLGVSQAALNAFRKQNSLFSCRIKEVYHYKCAEVYGMKIRIDRALIENGLPLSGCRIIDTERETVKTYEDGSKDIEAYIQEE